MKSFILSTLLFILLHAASAQVAMSLQEAEKQGLDVKRLDLSYKTGIGNDSIAVFKGQEDAYVKAYYAMLRDLGHHLNEHNFYWGGQVRCYNRIYFAADGSVDYYLFDFDANISESRQKQFKELLSQFIVSYKFEMNGKKQFAQCSPVNYRDPL